MTTTSSASRPVPTLRDSAARFVRAALLLRPYWGSYTKIVILGLLVAGLSLIGPYFMLVLVDHVYPSGSVSFLGLVVFAMLVHSLFAQLIGRTQGYYSQIVSAHLSADTTVFVLNQVQHLPLRFFERMPVGDLMSRFGDLGAALASVRSVFDAILIRGIFVLAVPPILLALNWRLALVAFATLPVTWLVNLASARALRGQWKRVAETRAEVRSVNVETLSHVRLLKSMGLERETFRRAVESTGAARVEAVSAARLNAGLGAINGVTQALGTLLFTYVGWRMVITGSLTLGGFLAFTAYLGRLAGPIARMTSLFSEFQRTAITLDRVFELLDQQTESDPRLLYQSNDDPPALRLAGDVRLDGIVMRYETGPFELRVPDLRFPEGSVTALVGESGAGKSTLLRLLAGIEQPDEGSVLYGGLAHHQLPLARIRQSVAVAWQQPELFRGTLRSNIAFGVADIGAEELDELVDVCQLRDLVDGLPKGLESPVAEWGQTLSGGQQQRLSLARALARDAPLLLLDEITANLDKETEEALLPRLFSRVAGRTVVIASHRASVLPYADRVVRLRRGRIEEEWETLRPDFTPILGDRSVASSRQ